jgi:hypothetical protein
MSGQHESRGFGVGGGSFSALGYEFPAVLDGGCERSGGIDLGGGRGCAGLQEEAFHPGRAEEQKAPARLPADVAAGVDHAARHVDRLPRRQARSRPVDVHFEASFDDVDRLGFVSVSVGRKGPSDGRMVDKQAKRSVGVIAVEVNLGANITGHPHHAGLGTHT